MLCWVHEMRPPLYMCVYLTNVFYIIIVTSVYLVYLSSHMRDIIRLINCVHSLFYHIMSSISTNMNIIFVLNIINFKNGKSTS